MKVNARSTHRYTNIHIYLWENLEGCQGDGQDPVQECADERLEVSTEGDESTFGMRDRQEHGNERVRTWITMHVFQC